MNEKNYKHDYTENDTRNELKVKIRYYCQEYDKKTGMLKPGLRKFEEIRYLSDWFISYLIDNPNEYKYLLIKKIEE